MNTLEYEYLVIIQFFFHKTNSYHEVLCFHGALFTV